MSLNCPTITMLTIKDTSIVNSEGKKIFLQGVNFGGWLMMEGYILYGRNIAEKIFKKEFRKYWGRKELDNFTKFYRDNFIQESDFINISSSGFNCIRLPFNYKLLEEKNGLKVIKNAVGLCKKYHIYCILDMHAAPGCQNQDWHSDSDGKSDLWTNKKYQEKFFRLWEMLAHEFKFESAVAGYNILNEPVINSADAGKILRNFYIKAVKRIRSADKKHIIFLEGNIWSQIFEHIGEPFADNLSYSFHFYHPLEFVFNFHKNLKYPGKISGDYWNKDVIKNRLEYYYNYSKKWNIPVFAGEFGVNSRHPEYYGELEWLKDVLECFKEFDFHWTYWTYKAAGNSVFPDGIYQYLGNPLWINRQGPVYGFENFYTLWKKNKMEIVESWKTGYFTKNEQLFNLLASFAAF